MLSSTAQFLSPIYSWGDKDEKKKVEGRGKINDSVNKLIKSDEVAIN